MAKQRQVITVEFDDEDENVKWFAAEYHGGKFNPAQILANNAESDKLNLTITPDTESFIDFGGIDIDLVNNPDCFRNEDDSPITPDEWENEVAGRDWLPEELHGDVAHAIWEAVKAARAAKNPAPTHTIAYAPMDCFGDTPFLVGRFINGEVVKSETQYVSLEAAESVVFGEKADAVIKYQVGDDLDAGRDAVEMALARHQNNV